MLFLPAFDTAAIDKGPEQENILQHAAYYSHT